MLFSVWELSIGMCHSRAREGTVDDHQAHYSYKRGGLNTFRYGGNYIRGHSCLFKRDLGAETQNGVYSTTNDISALKVSLGQLVYRPFHNR